MSSHSTGSPDGMQIPAVLPHLDALGVIHVRAGELPPDAAEVISEAGGSVLIVGDGAAEAAAAATAATGVWWCDTGHGLRPGRLASQLAAVAASVPLLVLPGTADGRDLAPRLAAALGRPCSPGWPGLRPPPGACRRNCAASMARSWSRWRWTGRPW